MKAWKPFDEARGFARSLQLKNVKEWEEYSKFGKVGIPKPDDIPSAPWKIYKNDWNGWIDWLGNEYRVHGLKCRKQSEEWKRKIGEAHKTQYIKILKGYGVSMTLKDNQILLKDGKSHFSREQEKEAWFVTKIPYDKIIISGKGYNQQRLSNSCQRRTSMLF